MILASNGTLNPGQQYTFTFNASWWVPFGAVRLTYDALLSDLAGDEDLKALKISDPATSPNVDFTFTFNGSPSSTVAEVAANIKQLVENNHTFVTMNFAQAATGDKGAENQSTDSISNDISKVAIVVVIVVVGLLLLQSGVAKGALDRT